MQRWEYRVVVLRGEYTASLNEFGADGWELVTVASEPLAAPTGETRSLSIPKPRALGAIEAAADKVSSLGGSASDDEAPATSRLLWVFRRPLGDD